MPTHKPWPDVSDARRRTMRAIKGKDTTPELAVRRLLHRLGYRFRLHRRDLPGTPDVVFPSRRRVVEVRGCFWHAHGCARSGTPKTRVEFWAGKLAANSRRDAANLRKLGELGWETLEVWQCEITDTVLLESRLMEFLGPPRREAGSGGRRCHIPRKGLQSEIGVVEFQIVVQHGGNRHEPCGG